MSKPQTIDNILDIAFSGLTSNTANLLKRDRTKAAIQSMLEGIIGENDWHGDRTNGYRRSSVDVIRNNLRKEQRQRATKYNLTLQGKERIWK